MLCIRANAHADVENPARKSFTNNVVQQFDITPNEFSHQQNIKSYPNPPSAVLYHLSFGNSPCNKSDYNFNRYG